MIANILQLWVSLIAVIRYQWRTLEKCFSSSTAVGQLQGKYF